MEDKITPEEKLLKIIENPQTQKRMPPAGPGAQSVAIKKDLSSLLKGLRIDPDISKYLTLPNANRAIAVICAIITVFFIIGYIIYGAQLNIRFNKIVEGASMADINAKGMSAAQDTFSNILEGARRRNIFTSLPMASPEQQQTGAAGIAGAPAEPAVESINNFKLVGIMWSDNPQAMIEDTKQNRTHLVGVGEKIREYKINKILKNKVILSKEKMEWELR